MMSESERSCTLQSFQGLQDTDGFSHVAAHQMSNLMGYIIEQRHALSASDDKQMS